MWFAVNSCQLTPLEFFSFLWDFSQHKKGQNEKEKKRLCNSAPMVMLNTYTSCVGNLESRSQSLFVFTHTKKKRREGLGGSLSITLPSLPPQQEVLWAAVVSVVFTALYTLDKTFTR